MTPNAMVMVIPPITPPAIAGAFDLRDDGEEVNDAEWENDVVEAGVEEGAGIVGIGTISSGV